MPTVKAGNRICQPITQANCRRDSRTGSSSMAQPLFYAAECAGLMWREAHSKLGGYAAGSDCATYRTSALGMRGDSGMRGELGWPVKYDQSHWRCTRNLFCSCGSERM